MDKGALDQQAFDSPALLTGELERVEQEVRSALVDLRPPFSNLVQGQLRRSFPLLCGAFVLTAGVGAAGAPRRNPHLAGQRIHLGAAIEMLRLALAVHTHLLAAADSPAQIDRSLLGSTILAGDYCFSRAAGLAARTDSPVVVDIFAQALQHVSEGTLRERFGLGQEPPTSFDVERHLCLSGVAAANELAELGAEERQVDQQLALLLLDQWQASDARQETAARLSRVLPARLSPHRQAAWQALQDWMQGRRG